MNHVRIFSMHDQLSAVGFNYWLAISRFMISTFSRYAVCDS